MTPWTDTVKQSGTLTIYIGTLVGNWAHVFRDALHEFNVLSSAYKLGVTIKESKNQPDGGAGANVLVQTANGPISASYDTETRSEKFDGERLHGRTMLFWRDPANVVEKAFVFLPSQPKVNTPKGQRAVGAGVMKVIAVHELLHSCGLDDADHSSDLFQANPRVNPGDNAAGDKVLIGTGPRSMPPLVLDGATAKKIKDLWAP